MLKKNTELQKSENNLTVPEQTHPGPVYTPPVDIFESEDRISLLADLPGVKAKDLKIDLRENVLTLSAAVTRRRRRPSRRSCWSTPRAATSGSSRFRTRSTRQRSTPS